MLLFQLLLEIHHFLKDVNSLKDSLDSYLQPAICMYDSLESQLSAQGIKGKKGNRLLNEHNQSLPAIVV